MQPIELRESGNEYHKTIVARTSQAIEALLVSGKTPSFYAVAKEAGVARSTLYRCDDLRALVVQARDNARGFCGNVATAHADNQLEQLRAEVASLRLERAMQLRKLEHAASRDVFTYAVVPFSNSSLPGSDNLAA